MGNRSKYKKVLDLYRVGTEVVFKDGTVMYIQAMNPFEVEEARRAAGVAKARFAMSVKKVGSDEHDQIMGNVEGAGALSAIDDLVKTKHSEHFIKAANEVQVDPDFKEHWDIIERSDDMDDRPADDPERLTLEILTKEYFDEVQKRTDIEEELYRNRLDAMSADELLQAYSEEWVSRRGQTHAIEAYNMAEMLSVCRVCDAVKVDDTWDHTACNHTEKVFEERADIEELPGDVLSQISEAIDSFNLQVRDAKN